MRRLLIADAEGVFGKAIQKHLQHQYLIKLCRNGSDCLEQIIKFDPDIALIDVSLPGTDGLTVIRALCTTGRDVKVVAISGYTGEYALSILESLGVAYIFSKPCDVGAVIGCVRELDRQIQNAKGWTLETEADRLLLSMGFSVASPRYQCVTDALCMKYRNFRWATTKELYPALAKQYNSNTKQVEKSIRDMIQSAWKCGNRSLWKLYFPPREGVDVRCPGNDEFLARMAKALMCKERLKLPLIDEM